MIIAIDTETGGVEPGKSALLSISACQYDNPSKTFNVYITPDPSLEITPEATVVNGYTPELWQQRGAVPLKEALWRFKDWMPRAGNSPLAHNATFDKAFIEAAELQTGFKTYLQMRWRCSMTSFMFASDALGLTPENYRLETLAKMCGHWGSDYYRGAHQSIDDVLACAAGYKWLRSKCARSSQEIDLEKAFLSEGLRLHDQINESNKRLSAAMEILTDMRWATNFTVSRDTAKKSVETDVSNKIETMKLAVSVL